MDNKRSRNSFLSFKISIKLIVIIILILLIPVVFRGLCELDTFIANKQLQRAEEFLGHIINLISNNSDDYKNYCIPEDIIDIEANKNKITNNYQIISRDRESSILWRRFKHERHEYEVLFDKQFKYNVTIGNYPDGKFKVYSWSGPYEKIDGKWKKIRKQKAPRKYKYRNGFWIKEKTKAP